MTSPTIEELIAYYARLQVLHQRVASEIVSTAAALRVAGVMPAGRPRVRPEFTTDEARAAHARYLRGLRDEVTVAGHRQYQREHKRLARSRAAS